ncbi:MAG TPA: sugar ABC transporter ATP-binding protein [Solirubrobacterales bacterium]|nr:sugar ABC transporter ATP-binding protein [Solirubrobacterales bacterium]
MGPGIATPRDPRLRAEGLSKTFGSARVLKDADIAIGAGEVHALLGANGSGKSTLIKCITGVEKPDRGARLEIDGHEVHGDYSTKAAHDLGVRVVHQEAPLIDSLTLAETVGHHRGFPKAGPLIRRRKLARETKEIFGRLGLEAKPEALASTLSPPERAMAMLALALGSGDGRLIVLDEPTASLTSGDAERFLEAVKEAARQGAGVLLVTHRLGEVFEICDSVTVLRDGAVVYQAPVAETSSERIVDEIVGPTADREVVAAAAVPERFLSEFAREAVAGSNGAVQPALEVEGMAAGVVEDVSFAVRPGEILGISGLLGSGAGEICAALAGALPMAAGTVRVAGRELRAGFGTREPMEAGVSFVPGDRLREGGIGQLSLVENMALPNLGHYGLSRRRRLEDFEEIVGALDVRPPQPQRAFGTLSGGNQQKVIVGKWALLRPAVFLLDNPTAGVDPGAREDILRLLRGLADAGTAVVVHSSEPEELSRLATRVLVVKEGRIAAELRGEEVTERAITAAN